MLRDDVERYIAIRRVMGYKLRSQACLLRHFARHAELCGDAFVRIETALAWAGQAPSPGQRRTRLQVARRFAQQMTVEDARHEVPPDAAFGPRAPRRTPHIFTAGQISQILAAAAALPPPGTLRPRTYFTLFALLASTGLRISEALALRLEDMTPVGLVVRKTKFRKSRLVPLHETARRGLEDYIAARARIAGLDPAVFLTLRGTAIRYPTVQRTFAALVQSIGLHRGPGFPGPRIHDLRHTFAVRSLEQCGSDRDSIHRHIPALSTYLGHARMTDTYWYLHATPRLMIDIADASEAFNYGGDT
jgi:integrase